MVSMMPSAVKPTPPMPAIPSKPLPRRPTLSGKVRTRDEADMDCNADLVAPSPGKRARVTFDPEIQVQVMDDPEKGLALIQEEVRLGIERHKMGDSVGYDRIKEVFTTNALADDAPSPATVTNHVVALISNVSLLSKPCSGLVHVILNGDWLGRDEAFIALYVKFLGNLVSAQSSYVTPVLKMLVAKFVHLPATTGHLPAYPSVRRAVLYSRAHMALKYMLQLVPSASSALSPILSSTFPHSSDSKKAHASCIENLLRLIDYAPELKSETLALITDRLVKIDVQVQVDLEDLEDEVGDGLVQDVSQQAVVGLLETDGDSEESDVDSTASDDDSMDEESRRLKDVRENVEKMDAVMDLLFAFYAPSYAAPSSVASQSAFRLLLNHFAAIILPTYRSRHTQFLLFHFAQSSPLLIDEFVGACAHLAFEPGRPSILKQSSAAYLASFIARGVHVPAQIVQDVFNVLGTQLDLIRLKEESSCPGPDLRRYGAYYALVQALLYIFCFRWRDLLATPEDYVEDDVALFDSNELTWAPGIKDILTRNILSKLNPLKVCSPSIVNEFARISHHLRFMYIYNIIETNKRVRFSHRSNLSHASRIDNGAERHTALTARKDDEHHQLDAYFPFDPYQLPKSKRWIEGDYVEWRGIPGLDDKPADGDDETEEDMEAESGDEGTDVSVDGD